MVGPSVGADCGVGNSRFAVFRVFACVERFFWLLDGEYDGVSMRYDPLSITIALARLFLNNNYRLSGPVTVKRVRQ